MLDFPIPRVENAIPLACVLSHRRSPMIGGEIFVIDSDWLVDGCSHRSHKRHVLTVVVLDRSSHSVDVKRFFGSIALAIEHEEPVAFDCEGVNLSRAGSVEVASLCFEHDGQYDTYLIDMGSKKGVQRACFDKVKELLESKSVRKIIHDARMDSDALFHLHGIKLECTHDTSSFHKILHHQEDIALNALLLFNGLSPNEKHTNHIYKINRAFWAKRPMTEYMKERAASDIDKLHIVARRQLDEVESRKRPGLLSMAYKASKDLAAGVREMQLTRRVRCEIPVGRFIGRGGSNIRSVQRRTGTLIYDEEERNLFMIFHRNDASLSLARSAMSAAW